MWPALGDFHPTASRDACDHLLAGLRGEDVCLAPTDNQCRAADFFEKPPHLLWRVRSKVGIKDGAVQAPYDLVITSGKAGGLEIVNRSKRLWVLLAEPPKGAGPVKPGATQGGYSLHLATCSNRLSSASGACIYRRLTASSRPTVETHYPRAQQGSPTKCRCRPPKVRAL